MAASLLETSLQIWRTVEKSASIRRSVWHDPGFTELPNARVTLEAGSF